MKIRITVPLITFCFIFGFAFWLRMPTFWLPHWQGDQSQYVMLAMKIGAGGGLSLSDYNLAQINVETLRIDDPPGTQITFPYIIKGDQQKGFVLDTYRQVGLGMYDVPFFYKAPLLPITLAVTHRLFAGKDAPFAVVKSHLGARVQAERPPVLFKAQFWAAVVPFAACLLVLLLIYLWARRTFGEGTALVAAFIFATNPISILTANRVWTEDLALVFMTAAMFLYRRGLGSGNAAICLASGITLGLSVLANQKGLLAAAALGIYTLLSNLARVRPLSKGLARTASDLRWWAFVAGLAAVTSGWFWTIHRHFGNPLWQPEAFVNMHHGKSIAAAAAAGAQSNLEQWYQVLLTQPHGAIYYTVGSAAICWALFAGYLTLRDGAKAGIAAASGRPFDERPLFLWCWISVYAAYFMLHRTGEYRYLFPVYPALIIASAWMLIRIERRVSTWMAHRFLSAGLLALFLAVSAVHSVRVVQPVLWEQKNLITAPWK